MLRYTRVCTARWRGFRPTTDSAELRFRKIGGRLKQRQLPTSCSGVWLWPNTKWEPDLSDVTDISNAVYSWNVLDVDDILFAQVSEVYHSRPLRGWIVIHRGEKLSSVNGFLCLLLYLIRDIAVSPSAGKTQFVSSIPGKTTCFLLKTNVRKDAK